MPKPYPDPNITNTIDLVTYVNQVTNDWFFILLLLVTNVILFIIFQTKDYKVSQCFAVSTTISFILGSLIWAMGLIEGRIISLWLGLMVVSLFYALLDK